MHIGTKQRGLLPLTSREKTLVFIERVVASISWRKMAITHNAQGN
jgi:hypothetical protein